MDTAALVFQSTHPSGVRPPSAHQSHCSTCYFNPRTPVGCDTPGQTPQQQANNFNPRTPVGCDQRSRIGPSRPQLISIHAPQWGATSRLCETRNASGFQSTHPSGVRLPPESSHPRQPTRFQSTHPSGVRPLRVVIILVRMLFQSTHPSGVRPSGSVCPRRPPYFNPRTPVGCDLPVVGQASTCRYFNPRTPVGCDSFVVAHAPDQAQFQSTHPSGVRPREWA